MATQTVSISLDLPDDCAIESLQSQLLQYARHLIQSDNYRKKQYVHEDLCGVLRQKTDQQELIDDYLKEKYHKKRSLSDLKGKIQFADDYDYKAMR